MTVKMPIKKGGKQFTIGEDGTLTYPRLFWIIRSNDLGLNANNLSNFRLVISIRYTDPS